jgi:hypothetical protein
MNPSEAGSLLLRQVKAPNPWEAFVLPVNEFPVPGPAVLQMQAFLRKFTSAARREWGLSLEVFFQVWRLTIGDAADRFSDGAPQWIPRFGLGVWPDRKPPARWTVETYMDAAAGDEPPVSIYKLGLVTATEEVRLSSVDAMLGCGTVLQVMTSLDSDSFMAKGREVFLPSITDRAFKDSRFYVPLLEAKTLQAATSAQIESWSCGASVYIRESVEDKGLLIASKEPLRPLFEKLGGKLELKPDPEWQFPASSNLI